MNAKFEQSLRECEYSEYRKTAKLLERGCDALVLPSRYKGYGRTVQEALCCGLPAQPRLGYRRAVSRRSRRRRDVANLAVRLARWCNAAGAWRDKIRPFSAALRDHTWRRMAGQLVPLIERYRDRSSLVRESRRSGFAA